MTDTNSFTDETRENGTHDRSPLTWAVASGAVVLLAAAVVLGLMTREHDGTPAPQATVTQLGVAPVVGRCPHPSVGALRGQTIAFRGTLTRVSAGGATFRVQQWFTGGPTDLAEVASTPANLRPLAESASFRVGGTYLVSAREGQVTGCGSTGPDTGRLARLYAQAYGG